MFKLRVECCSYLSVSDLSGSKYIFGWHLCASLAPQAVVWLMLLLKLSTWFSLKACRSGALGIVSRERTWSENEAKLT